MTTNNEHAPLVLSYTWVRFFIGILGLLLPVLLIVGHALWSGAWVTRPTISHYYYTNMSDILVAVLSMFGIFMLVYVGYDQCENKLANIAAVMAIFIGIFPTTPARDLDIDAFKLMETSRLYTSLAFDFAGTVHDLSVLVFFGILGYFSVFKFPLTEADQADGANCGKNAFRLPLTFRTPFAQRPWQHNVYIICGFLVWLTIIMLASSVLLAKTGVPALESFHQWFYYNTRGALIVEVLCLWSFGTSWVVKSYKRAAQ